MAHRITNIMVLSSSHDDMVYRVSQVYVRMILVIIQLHHCNGLLLNGATSSSVAPYALAIVQATNCCSYLSRCCYTGRV